MKYRSIGKKQTGVSILGFGAMRLPLLDDDPQNIDRKKAKEMLIYAIDKGINYIDTAYPYHGGKSEVFLGEFLQENDLRDKIHLATKLPVWLIENRNEPDKYFQEQKSRLKTDHFDFYLLHSLNQKSWEKIIEYKILDWAESKKRTGEITQFGFSFHDDLKTFKKIVDGYDNWDFCQIQYNYMDINYQAGKSGMNYAYQKGISIIIMEPLRGGQLSKKPPAVIEKIWDKSKFTNTYSDRALQWLWNQKEISLVLSGMSNLQQVKENIRSAELSGTDSLNNLDLAFYNEVRKAYLDLCPIPCTQCRYCLPCPEKVEIPRVLEIYNMSVMYEDLPRAKILYKWIKDENKADRCIECGLCEEKCPQNIEIRKWLKVSHKILSTDNNKK